MRLRALTDIQQPGVVVMVGVVICNWRADWRRAVLGVGAANHRDIQRRRACERYRNDLLAAQAKRSRYCTGGGFTAAAALAMPMAAATRTAVTRENEGKINVAALI